MAVTVKNKNLICPFVNIKMHCKCLQTKKKTPQKTPKWEGRRIWSLLLCVMLCFVWFLPFQFPRGLSTVIKGSVSCNSTLFSLFNTVKTTVISSKSALWGLIFLPPPMHKSRCFTCLPGLCFVSRCGHVHWCCSHGIHVCAFKMQLTICFPFQLSLWKPSNTVNSLHIINYSGSIVGLRDCKRSFRTKKFGNSNSKVIISYDGRCCKWCI